MIHCIFYGDCKYDQYSCPDDDPFTNCIHRKIDWNASISNTILKTKQ